MEVEFNGSFQRDINLNNYSTEMDHIKTIKKKKKTTKKFIVFNIPIQN